MNILNRIKRLESESGTDKPFCECFNEHRRKMIDAVYESAPYEEKDIKLPEDKYCRKCKKPVNVEFEERMERNLLLIYGDL